MRRSLPRSLAFASAIAGAGCDSGPLGPNLHIVVANTATAGNACANAQDGTVPALPNYARMRLTTRVHQGAANVTGGLCDVVVDGTSNLPTVALPTAATGSTVDFFAEAFAKNADGTFKRIASGATLGVTPTQARTGEVLVRLFAAEAFRCVPGAALKTGRAFHTATALPNGQVLFTGGLAVPSGGVQDAFTIIDGVEVYDPTTRQMVPVADDGAAMAPVRAFHHAAVIGSPAANQFDILLVGGVTTSKPQLPALQTNTVGALNTFRLRPVGDGSALSAAKPEILHYVYDPTSGKATITRDTGVSVALHSLAYQAGAAIPSDDPTTGLDAGLVVAGGTTLGAMAMADTHLDVTGDGSSVSSGMLTAPRIGAAIVAYSTSAGLLLGGLSGTTAASPARLTLSSRPPVATDVMVTTGQLPALLFPTVVELPDTGQAGHQLLVLGGLDATQNPNNQPPSGLVPTLIDDAGGAGLTATAATSTKASFDCAKMGHIKSVAFNAATVLDSPDPAHARVLSTGGTAGTGSQGSCADCESGDNVLSCALHQAAIYDVGGNAMDLNAGGAEQLQIARWGHTQTTLRDGMVLVAGGMTRVNQQTQSVSDFELYNPARRDAVTTMTNGTTNDLDDPVFADLAGRYSRKPGEVAHAPTADPAVTPALACGAPHQ